MNFEEARPFMEKNHRGVITTYQRNGAMHTSIVVCGAYKGNAAFVIVYGKSAKTRNLRRDPRCTVMAVDNDWRGYSLLLGTTTVEYSWVADGITEDEMRALSHLATFGYNDVSFAEDLAGMPFLTSTFEPHDRYALSSLLYLESNFPNLLDLIKEQPWFVDGVDDLEAAFVVVVGTRQDSLIGPEDLRDFVLQHHGESLTTSLPLAGEVAVTFFQSVADPKNQEIVTQVEDAIRVLEEFMGVPFPEQEVILLFASPGELNLGLDFEITGLNRGTHIVVDPNLARQGDTNRTLNHEVAHYYWGSQEAPLWFREGAADFLSSYVRDQLYNDPIAVQKTKLASGSISFCNQMAMYSIQKLIDTLAREGIAAHQQTQYFICNYSYGEFLFINLYETIGHDAFRAAFGDLYRLSLNEERPVTEDEIYQAFLRHTPAASVGAFQSVYSDLHGGDFAG